MPHGATAEYLAAFKPGYEQQLVRIGNIEVLAIGLRVGQLALYTRGYAWVYNPGNRTKGGEQP